jgi:hypothetical protein
MIMMLPTRCSMAPTVAIPTMRRLAVALYTSQDGDVVSVLESVAVGTHGSNTATVRPSRKAK